MSATHTVPYVAPNRCYLVSPRVPVGIPNAHKEAASRDTTNTIFWSDSTGHRVIDCGLRSVSVTKTAYGDPPPGYSSVLGPNISADTILEAGV